MHSSSRGPFNISVISGPPCLELLVKWLSASGLCVTPCRTKREFQIHQHSVVVVEDGYRFPETTTSALCWVTHSFQGKLLAFSTDLPGKQRRKEPPGSGLEAVELAEQHFELPLQLGRLIAHLRALGKSQLSSECELLSLGSLVVNPLTREVCTGEGEVVLTALQFDLLSTLLEEPGKVFSARELLRRLERLQTGSQDPSVVRYHVARLRARLGQAACYIENVRGCGYRAQGSLLA